MTLIVIALCMVLGMAGLNREAFGEPIVPEQFTRMFNKSDPGLPEGLNYELSIINPGSGQTITQLPQLGTVEVRLALTNDTALPMTLNFPTSLQCEFTVRRIYSFLGGLFVVPLEVWRSSYFHNYVKRPTKLVLKPGETKVYSADWTINGLNESQVPSGTYRVYTSLQGVKTLGTEKPL